MASMLTSGFFIYIQLACIRYMSGEVHPFEIVFFRGVFGALVLLPVFWRQGFEPMRSQRRGMHLMRAGLHAVTLMVGFYALSLIPLADFAALTFTAPLFGTLLAWILLREPFRPTRVATLVVGFIGAWIVIRPGFAEVSAGAVMMLGSSFVSGALATTTKSLSRTESSLTITIYASFAMIPYTLVASIPFWTWPSLTALGWLALIGALGSVIQLTYAQAMRDADATLVLSLEFFKLIWASLLGFLVWREIPAIWTILGGLTIFVAVTSLAAHESRSSRLAALPPAETP
ncbi:MAG: EamA/RhaT family transporter [Rhodospirillales bacterium]|nr:EamA/RhaT family transporter [Rhodospirillales bacterium]